MNTKGKNYKEISAEVWSKSLDIRWNFDVENPIYDRFAEEKYYPNDVKLIAGWVKMSDFFNSIPECHRLIAGDIWEHRQEYKINNAIDFWKEGNKMTPILIDTFYNYAKRDAIPICNLSDGIIIRAGFHRFSVCCLVGEDKIPFFTPNYSKKDVEKFLKKVEWIL